MSSTATVKDTGAKVECIIPILNVTNFSASIDYYVNVLGFRVEWDWGDPPDVGSVERDDYSIMLCENEQGHPGTWIWMGVEDAEKYYEEYKASGAKIREAPNKLSLGIRIQGGRPRWSRFTNRFGSQRG